MVNSEQMWKWALSLPEQLEYESPGLKDLSTGDRPPRRVLVAGMGGSGVSARFLEALSHTGDLPVIPWSWAGAPAWLSRGDALVAISYSGDTAETLATLRDGLERGASVTGVSTGGNLCELMAEKNLSCLRIPGGMPPRAAFGYLLGTSLRAIERLAKGIDLNETVAALKERRSELDADGFSGISELARRLKDRPLVIYGTDPLTAAAALRLKQQLNENAKIHAWANTLPELAHNEIEGAGPGVPPHRICLTPAEEPPPLDEVLQDGARTIYLRGRGPNPLAAALGLVLQGDLLSLELARERGVEPYPIRRIMTYKERGRSGGSG